MEENVLITGKYHKGKFKKWYKILAIIAILLLIATVLYNFIQVKITYEHRIAELKESQWQYDKETGRERYLIRMETVYTYDFDYYYKYGELKYKSYNVPLYTDSYKEFLDGYEHGKYSSFQHYFKTRGGLFFAHPFGIVLFCTSMTSVLIIITTLIIHLILSKCKLMVTDKNVRGKTSFGKTVVLPLDMISAYSTKKLFSTIAIRTSSGVAKFSLVENYQEIGNTLSSLINERQTNVDVVQQQTATKSTQTQAQPNNLDELKKLKDLLDLGIITQEEFETKKKQLLGL